MSEWFADWWLSWSGEWWAGFALLYVVIRPQLWLHRLNARCPEPGCGEHRDETEPTEGMPGWHCRFCNVTWTPYLNHNLDQQWQRRATP